MANTSEYRNKHTTFTYSDYSWKLDVGVSSDLVIKFTYAISPDITFEPSLTIHNVTQEMIDRLGRENIDNYVFAIGMSEVFSYWKTTASPTIAIGAGQLSEEQISFWHKLLLKGMGEFFYTNKIEFNSPDFVKIISESDKNHSSLKSISDNHPLKNNINPQKRILIPVGGGKDSSVTLELLKQNYAVGSYTVSAPVAAQDIISIAQVPLENQIKITRKLDPKLFELNSAGYLNGHVPISAFLAFLSIFVADLFEYTHVAISNERSSNEGNTWYCDQEINHQYSKTFEFESDLQHYVSNYLPKNAPLYFSFLRPLYELQIAQIFAQMSHYHPVFRSCNAGQKENIWCGNCSKCLFAFVILSPFIGQEKIVQHFGKNLFTDESLWETTKELLGISTTKPFECVGTHEETIIAFYLSIQKYLESNQKLPIILEKVSEELQTNIQLKTGPNNENSYAKRSEDILSAWNAQNSLPDDIALLLKQSLEKSKDTP